MKSYRCLRSKILFFLALITIAMPNVIKADWPNIGQAGYYRAVVWFDYDVGNFGAALPPKLYWRFPSIALGFAPPIGIGIGTALFELAGPFNRPNRNGFGVFAPIPLYIYWVPYVKWKGIRYGLIERSLAQQVAYMFFGFSKRALNLDNWSYGTANEYIRCGLHYRYIWGKKESIGIGAEVGYISYKRDNWSSPAFSFYCGLTLHLGNVFGGLIVE